MNPVIFTYTATRVIDGEDCIVSRRRYTRPKHNATLTLTKRANYLLRSIKYYS